MGPVEERTLALVYSAICITIFHPSRHQALVLDVGGLAIVTIVTRITRTGNRTISFQTPHCLPPCGGYRLLYFEELFQDLRSTLDPVEKAHGINVVGGSTRIPRIVKLVSNFFIGKEHQPSEAVAYGTAVQAAILSDNTSE
jgi:hypothetical protein